MDMDVCPLCLYKIETILHAVRDCIKANQIWQDLGAKRVVSNFFGITTIRDGAEEYVKEESYQVLGITWNVLFSVAIWWIWRYRNDHVFGRDTD